MIEFSLKSSIELRSCPSYSWISIGVGVEVGVGWRVAVGDGEIEGEMVGSGVVSRLFSSIRFSKIKLIINMKITPNDNKNSFEWLGFLEIKFLPSSLENRIVLKFFG